MADTPNVNTCIYNDNVDCDEAKCALCGWNPDVSAKRIKAYEIAQAQSRFKDKTLYRIPFTGYCEVWAASPEEAIDSASNEDMFFVHYEFKEPICQMKEENDEVER